MDVDVRSQLHFARGLKRCRLLLLFIACNLPIELPAQKSSIGKCIRKWTDSKNHLPRQ
jgi:hypothetical protein